MQEIQLSMFTDEVARTFAPRSRGRIKYRKFSVHERINWKSYWWGYASIMHYHDSNTLKDFPVEESLWPCDNNVKTYGFVKLPEPILENL